MEDGPIKIGSSADLSGLEPQSERDYLMIMFPTQRTILKTLEEVKADMNEFTRKTEGRLGRLEASFTVGGMIVIAALFGLALKVVFGG